MHKLKSDKFPAQKKGSEPEGHPYSKNYSQLIAAKNLQWSDIGYINHIPVGDKCSGVVSQYNWTLHFCLFKMVKVMKMGEDRVG